MAGPWSISRDRRDGDLRDTLGRNRSPAARTPLLAVLSGSVRTGARTKNIWSWREGRTHRAPRAALKIRAWWAIPVIALMTAAAVLLTWATASLAQSGIAASNAASAISGGRLVSPAPRSAGGLPLRVGTTQDPADQAIITRLEHRFSVVSSRLLAGALRGTSARATSAVRPSGIYGEPGHLDPVSSRPSWIKYLGLQSPARFGQPSNTISTLMMGILGNYSKIGPWPVAAGHRGGQANCTVAWLAGTEVSVCGWATARTIGIVASPARDTSVGALATLLIKMRYGLQRRG